MNKNMGRKGGRKRLERKENERKGDKEAVRNE